MPLTPSSGLLLRYQSLQINVQNKNEFITKINKITIEAETETKDEEIRSRIIEYTPVLPEGIRSTIVINAQRKYPIMEFAKNVKLITEDSPSFSLTIDSPVNVDIK